MAKKTIKLQLTKEEYEKFKEALKEPNFSNSQYIYSLLIDLNKRNDII